MKIKQQTSRAIALATTLAAGLFVSLTGCQSVPISYMEPARLNMSGISKVGIISNDSEATMEISTAMTNTGAYTIATSDELSGLLDWQRQQSLLSEAVETNAANIIKAYEENAMRADLSYQKKPVKVTGIVTEIKQRAVRLGVGNNSVDIYIKPSETGKAAALSKGVEVTMVGRCYGLDVPDSSAMGELFNILGGGKHINITEATFYTPEYEGVDALLRLKSDGTTKIETREVNKPVKKSDGSYLKDAEGKTVSQKVTEYGKLASATLSYELIRFDNSLVGSGAAQGSARSSYYEKTSDLPSDASLISSAKKSLFKKIISDMVPTERNLSVQLAKSDNKDKEFKTAMNEAKKLVSAKDYAGAADAYGKIYAETKDFAAGYNQAVLTEATVGVDKAVILMEALAASSGKQEAQSMLNEMRQRNLANQRSAEQLKN